MHFYIFFNEFLFLKRKKLKATKFQTDVNSHFLDSLAEVHCKLDWSNTIIPHPQTIIPKILCAILFMTSIPNNSDVSASNYNAYINNYLVLANNYNVSAKNCPVFSLGQTNIPHLQTITTYLHSIIPLGQKIMPF